MVPLRHILTHRLPHCLDRNFLATRIWRASFMVDIETTLLFQHRRALDDLRRCVLAAGNAFSSTLMFVQRDQVGSRFLAAYDECITLRDMLSSLNKELRHCTNRPESGWPSLDSVQRDALRSLDLRLARQEIHLCRWLQQQIPMARTSWRSGDWGELDRPFWVNFEVSPEISPKLAETVYPLQLGARFPGMRLIRLLGYPSPRKTESPLFEFGTWSREPLETEVDFGNVRSELLIATLPRVAELAYIASVVTACTLTIDGGSQWRVELGLNTEMSPPQ